jgi:hypothetical protein
MVTVQTVDFGAVTFPEPNWCRGDHLDGGHRVDITCEGPEYHASMQHGDDELRFLGCYLTMWPFASDPAARSVRVAVDVDGDYIAFNSRELGELSAALSEHVLMQLIPLRRRLQALEGGGV